jgi:HSP20 family protein
MVDGISKSGAERSSDTEWTDSSGMHWRIRMRSPHWTPPTDVYETEENVIVRVEIAGMREEDFVVELNGRELLVRGNRLDTAERRSFYQMEIRFGEFALALELPSHIITEEVMAVYQNGFLLVSLPKAQPRQIQVSE